jgi:hypothetical protein
MSVQNALRATEGNIISDIAALISTTSTSVNIIDDYIQSSHASKYDHLEESINKVHMAFEFNGSC